MKINTKAKITDPYEEIRLNAWFYTAFYPIPLSVIDKIRSYHSGDDFIPLGKGEFFFPLGKSLFWGIWSEKEKELIYKNKELVEDLGFYLYKSSDYGLTLLTTEDPKTLKNNQFLLLFNLLYPEEAIDYVLDF